MPRKIDPNTLTPKHGVLPSKSVDDNAFLYPERDVDPLRVHLHDPSRAHMASAIGIVDAADCYISDEVEGALQEICSGWGAGRMNGMVEGGYLVSPADSGGNPPYPAPTAASGLLIKLVEPATGNPSTVLIGSHTVDISGAEYNFATGIDPVGGAPTSANGTYYLYVETDSASADYRGLVASTTLPTVASEKILIAQITHDGADITGVVDCRYFVANLDRKLPFTLRSGIPTAGIGTNGTFGGENADTWGEALFQTLEAALFWITQYDGPGDTQEEKATVIVRGRQILTQNYSLPEGICLQGSGPDAQIVFQGTGNLFTLVGDNIRINDIRFTLDNDINVNCTAIATLGAGGLVEHFSMERCTFDKETASLHWQHAINATNTAFWSLSNCNLMAGRAANSIASFATHQKELIIADCNFDGIGVADNAITFKQPGNGFEASITDCTFENLTIETGATNGTAIYYANDGSTASNDQYLRVSGCNFATVLNGIYSELGQNVIEGNKFNCSAAGNPGTAIVGIHINGDSQNIAATVIENCVIEGNRVECLKSGGPATWVADSEPTGILIEGAVFSPKVTGNTVVGDWINSNPGNTGSAIFGSAIGFHESIAAHSFCPSGGVVSNNFIANNVIIERARRGLTFTGNQVINEEAAAKVTQLLVGAGSRDVTITGNVFKAAVNLSVSTGAEKGIVVYGDASNADFETKRVTITGNTLHDHSKVGISLAGHVLKATIQGNTLETQLENYLPTAEGIVLHGEDPVGSAEEVIITGNQLHRFIRGIRVSGYMQNDTVEGASHIVVSNNSIKEIAEARTNAPYSEDNPFGTNQGILFQYTEQGTATGNILHTIGMRLNAAGVPTPVPGNDYYGIGIHAWFCRSTTITNNSIHNLYCHKSNATAGQPFNMGIYLANSSWGAPVGNIVGPDLVADNVIESPFENTTNRLNTLAAIGYLAQPRVLGAANAPLTQQALKITGNICNAAADGAAQALTTQVPSPFWIGNSTQGPGSCGIMAVMNYKDSSTSAIGAFESVHISDNQIGSFGTKGIFFYVDGSEDDGCGASLVSIQDNTIIGGAVERTTYVNAQTIQMDGGIAVLARGYVLLGDLAVKGNSIRGALYSGISFGMVPVNAHTTPSRQVTLAKTAVSDNDIQGLMKSASATFSETFGIMPRVLIDTAQSDVAKIDPLRNFVVSNNQIGKRPASPDSQVTGVDWGVLFALTDVDSVANRAAVDMFMSSVTNNTINTQYSAVAIDQDATTLSGAVSALLENITISGNHCFRIPTVYAAGGEHTALYRNQIIILGEVSALTGISVMDNVTEVWRNSGSAAQPVIGCAITNANSPEANNIRITGNTFDTSPNFTASTYAGSSVALVFQDVPITRSVLIEDNTCTGAISFTHNSDVPDVARLSVQRNTIGDPLSTTADPSYGSSIPLYIRVQGTNPPFTPWIGTGLNQCVVQNNLITAHNDATAPNDFFQVELDLTNCNAHNVVVSNNEIDLQKADLAGGIVVNALLQSHCFQWAVSNNQIIGGGKPHIYYAGDGDSIANQWCIDDNQCSRLNFPDGGWGAAAGHPDSVILFEGSALAVAEREADEDISISGNEFMLIDSTRPNVISPGSNGIEDTPGNAAIYFGPNPDMLFTDGDGSQSWQAVRNLRIDDNRMADVDMDVGITVNVYAVKYDVSNVSVSRNIIGHPTKNITGGSGGFEFPNYGIYFLGKLLYDATSDPSSSGRQGMSQINIDDNQVVLWNTSAHTSLGGITMEWKSQWDNTNTGGHQTYAYKAQSISVCGNQVNLRGLFSGFTQGIGVTATSDMHNFRMDGNNIASPQTLDGSAGSNGFDRGLFLGHEFIGSSGATPRMLEVQTYAGIQTTSYGNNGGVFVTGEISGVNPDLGKVKRKSDNASVSIKTVSWENVSVSNNSVLGDCIRNSTVFLGLPATEGAFVIKAVNYSGSIVPSDTRKQTMLPIYNFTMRGNKIKNDRVYNPEVLSINIEHIGYRILLAPLNRNFADVSQNMSGLYRGWNIGGNTANWYAMCEDTTLPAAPALIRGFDIDWDLGGMPSAGRVAGTSGENYCAQISNTVGPPVQGDKDAGWDLVFAEDVQNINDNPWMFPI